MTTSKRHPLSQRSRLRRGVAMSFAIAICLVTAGIFHGFDATATGLGSRSVAAATVDPIDPTAMTVQKCTLDMARDSGTEGRGLPDLSRPNTVFTFGYLVFDWEPSEGRTMPPGFGPLPATGCSLARPAGVE